MTDKYDVLLVGCFGYPNLGDELILRAWLNSIFEYDRELKILVDCHRPSLALSICGDYGEKVTYQDCLWQIVWNAPDSPAESFLWGKNFLTEELSDIFSQRFLLSRFENIKLIILCGGGYIRKYWNKHYSLLGIIHSIKKLLDIPVVMTGQGFIPFDCDTSSFIFSILNDFEYVSVRDRWSYEKVKEVSTVFHGSYIDDTFLFRNSPLGKNYIPVSDEKKYQILVSFF